MKTYKVKNYKGNLVESLSKFQKSHKGMKIVEAAEDGEELKIKAEESSNDSEYNAKEKLWDTIKNIVDDFRALANDGYYETNQEQVFFAEAFIDLINNAAENRSGEGGFFTVDPSMKKYLNSLKNFVAEYQ